MRKCGSCDACCTVLEVPGLAPQGCNCPHQTGSGCGNYANRPDACRQWSCQWIQDNLFKKQSRLFRDDERPDRVGVMFDILADHRLVAHELRPGAFAGAGAEVVTRVEQNNRAVRVPYWSPQ